VGTTPASLPAAGTCTSLPSQARAWACGIFALWGKIWYYPSLSRSSLKRRGEGVTAITPAGTVRFGTLGAIHHYPRWVSARAWRRLCLSAYLRTFSLLTMPVGKEEVTFAGAHAR